MIIPWQRAAHTSSAIRSRRRRLSCEPLEARDVPSTVSGFVFNDLNGNTNMDAGEPGLEGWTVFVDDDRDAIPDGNSASAVTDVNGYYSINSTSVPTYNGGTGQFAEVVLDTGVGGRWLNTTLTSSVVRPGTEPIAVRNFGASFVSNADAGFVPVGPEQLVNEVTAGEQGHSMSGPPVPVAADAAGNYVVAWLTDVNQVSRTISARVFNADGTPRTSEITVAVEPGPNNTQYSTDISMPALAVADNGKFIVAWPGATGFKTRVYNADGTPVTGPVVGPSGYPVRVAADAVGNFAVLFTIPSNSNGTPVIKFQRYSSAGVPSGNATTVANVTLVNGTKSLAMDDSGKFVVVWDDVTGKKTLVHDVFAQRYSANGQKLGSQITVATASTTDRAWQSNVAMSNTGNFAIVWATRTNGAFNVRRFNADGTANGGVIRMGQFRGGEAQSAIGLEDAGDITLAWTSGGTLDSNSIYASRLPVGSTTPYAETLVSATTIGSQRSASLAVTGSGSFVVAWQGYGPGDDAGIFAQRFGPVVGGVMADAGFRGLPITSDTVDLTGLELVAAPGTKSRFQK